MRPTVLFDGPVAVAAERTLQWVLSEAYRLTLHHGADLDRLRVAFRVAHPSTHVGVERQERVPPRRVPRQSSE
jgi:hypothetical protein